MWLSGHDVKLDINEYTSLGSMEKIIAQLSNLLARPIDLVQIISQKVESVTPQSAVFVKCNLKGVGHVWGIGVGVGGMAIARSVMSALMVSAFLFHRAC
jgi:hypothetical protein